MSDDEVFDAFLRTQEREGMDLDRRSDVVDVEPIVPKGSGATEPSEPRPPSRYLLTFHCQGLVRTANGIEICDRHQVGVAFPPNYLLDPPNVAYLLTWLGPAEAFHSNIRAPFICIGNHVPPGMTLVNLIHQIRRIITWQKFSAHDALNSDACIWARANIDTLPIDPRRSLFRSDAITKSA